VHELSLCGHLRRVNPTVLTIEVSARTGLGADDWCGWLLGQVSRSEATPEGS
jgi:hypothetical protein